MPSQRCARCQAVDVTRRRIGASSAAIVASSKDECMKTRWKNTRNNMYNVMMCRNNIRKIEVNNKHETPTLALTRSVGIFFALQLRFLCDPERTRVQNPSFQINRSAACMCSCRLFLMLDQESQIPNHP
jgi:hypothetical protein